MIKLKLKRESNFVNFFRKYKIILDNNTVGYIKNGGQFELDIPEGMHSLYLEIDWCKSNIVIFNANKDVSFECGTIGGLKFFLAMFYILFFPHKYLWLKQID